MATPSLRSVCTILHDFWCRVVILSVSSPNEPKSRVFPPNAIQVQTMFNVLNGSTPIPETLSSEGNDFLKRCLQKNTRNMDDRSSAETKKSHSPPSTRHSSLSTLEVLLSVYYPEVNSAIATSYKVAFVLIVRSEMHVAYATYMWNDAFNKRTSISGP
ncbi:hypothetical protein Tco_0639031 [Tanacetum coccineum]